MNVQHTINLSNQANEISDLLAEVRDILMDTGRHQEAERIDNICQELIDILDDMLAENINQS